MATLFYVGGAGEHRGAVPADNNASRSFELLHIWDSHGGRASAGGDASQTSFDCSLEIITSRSAPHNDT